MPWLRARLRSLLLEILEIEPAPPRARELPPCLFERDHEWDPWQVMAYDFPKFSIPIITQQRRCIACGLTQETALCPPAAAEAPRVTVCD